MNILKYLLLVLGVVVAMIIVVTTFNVDEKKTGKTNASKPDQPRMNLSLFRFLIQ